MEHYIRCSKCGGFIPELRFGGVNIHDCKNHIKPDMTFKNSHHIGCKKCGSLNIETHGMSRRCLDCGNVWTLNDSGERLGQYQLRDILKKRKNYGNTMF